MLMCAWPVLDFQRRQNFDALESDIMQSARVRA